MIKRVLGRYRVSFVRESGRVVSLDYATKAQAEAKVAEIKSTGLLFGRAAKLVVVLLVCLLAGCQATANYYVEYRAESSRPSQVVAGISGSLVR